jgi:hypothetical protein
MKYFLTFVFAILALGFGLWLVGAKLNCSTEIWVIRAFALFYFTFFSPLPEIAEKIMGNIQR